MTSVSQSCQNTPSAFLLVSEMLQPGVYGHTEYKRKHSSKDHIGLKNIILCHHLKKEMWYGSGMKLEKKLML